MGKILALDVGDVWTGMALSDSLGLIARPYKTVKTNDLEEELRILLEEEVIDTVIVGHPRTMKGAISEQTKKAQLVKEQLEQRFEMVSWILWDERLTSAQAESAMLGAGMSRAKRRKRVDRMAAQIILQSFLAAEGK